MGFDLDRSEANRPADLDAPDPAAVWLQVEASQSVFSRALSQNLKAERFAIDAYRKIAAHGHNYDRATLRLIQVALAVEEEHAEILTTLIENLHELKGPAAENALGEI